MSPGTDTTKQFRPKDTRLRNLIVTRLEDRSTLLVSGRTVNVMSTTVATRGGELRKASVAPRERKLMVNLI